MTTQQTITVPLFVNGEGMMSGGIRDSFMPAEPPELELGVLELDDGSSSLVVLIRPDVVGSGVGLTDITTHGGWRSYRAALGAR